MHFGTFLKDIDPDLYRQYVFERYTDGEQRPKSVRDFDKLVVPQTTPIFDTLPSLDEVATRLDRLPDTNEAVQYCLARSIDRKNFVKLYYIAHTKDIARLAPEKYGTMASEEPRLVLPFYNERGKLTGVAMRALRGEALRYINAKFTEDDCLIFGLQDVDRLDQEFNPLPIYVLEGPLDSLFIPNSIAVAGVGFGKLDKLNLSKEQLCLIFDNEPRNRDVCRLMEQYIGLGYQIVVWPCMEGKDINEMILNGVEPVPIIKANTYSGMMAMAKFTEWRKC